VAVRIIRSNLGNVYENLEKALSPIQYKPREDMVVEAVKENSAAAIGMSVLLTSMVDSIGDVVGALKEAGLRESVKIAIGGECTTKALADKMGVDALGRDAVEAVRIFDSFVS